jgi:hypothetical protein
MSRCQGAAKEEYAMRKLIIGAAALIALTVIPGCGGNNTYSPNFVGGAALPAITVTISPPTANLSIYGTQTFTATVTNALNTAVTWSVQDGGAGGSITQGGVYSAINNTGTDTVVATSVADPTKSGTAIVTVSDQSTPPGSLQGTIK